MAPRLSVLAFAIVTLFPTAVRAGLPLWELGVGAVAFRQPHYPGADQARNLLLPFPYFTYRGEKIRAENGRVRGLLLSTDDLDIDVSLGGALPVSSDDNDLRTGMPDLDPVLEFGPSIKWYFSDFFNGQPDRGKLLLELPLRWANSIDGVDIDERGWISTPQLAYRRESEFTRMQLTLGAVYGSEQFQDYFYAVDPEFVTGDRPYYDAGAGLMTYRATINYQKRFGDIIVGAYAAYYDLSDAENFDSPLLADESQFSIGLRMAWILKKSKQKVKTR